MLHTLVNHQNGNLAFKIFSFEDAGHFDHLQRNNFYSLIWVSEGLGRLKSDFSEYAFEPKSLFAFAPYQPFMFSAAQPFKGVAVQFHSDFFCIHRNPADTNCDAVLFNNIYQPPFFTLDRDAEKNLTMLLNHFQAELEQTVYPKHELLAPYLKILLVTAVRLQERSALTALIVSTESPYILHRLKSAIEENFKEKHSAGDYAELLNISSNALAKITKSHFNKTLTDLISERIIIEAKRELYFSNRTVKEIAYRLGYADEFYFSRFFKTNTDVSPTLYRETVGFGKAEGSSLN